MLSIMSDADRTISHEELVELQKKFSEIKHSINNALAVMMALSEMSQRRPDYSEKLASTVLDEGAADRLQPAGIHPGLERESRPEAGSSSLSRASFR